MNAAGDLIAWVIFDTDDPDAAYAELDARYAAGELAADHLKPVPRLGAAIAARDWEAAAARLAPDLVVTDHRPLGWETMHGPSAYVASLRSLFELAPDARLRVDHVRSAGRATLLTGAWLGTREGGAIEAPRVAVNEWNTSGLVVRMDFYELDQLEEAWRHYAELGARFAGTSAPAPADLLAALVRPNAASAASARFRAAFAARDWTALRACCATDVRFEDRRPFALVSADLETMIEDLRPLAEMEGGDYRLSLLATGASGCASSTA